MNVTQLSWRRVFFFPSLRGVFDEAIWPVDAVDLLLRHSLLFFVIPAKAGMTET